MMPHAPDWPTAVITWVMEEVQRSLWQQQGQGVRWAVERVIGKEGNAQPRLDATLHGSRGRFSEALTSCCRRAPPTRQLHVQEHARSRSSQRRPDRSPRRPWRGGPRAPG